MARTPQERTDEVQVIPAALALSLAAGLAQAQTAPPPNTGATTGAITGAPASPSTANPNTGAARLGSPTVGGPSRSGAGGTNNAVNTAPQNNPGAPQPGANSFTEGQARSRIEDKGFQNVQGLKKDDQGIWRGQAMKNGKQVSVALDYQGNVVGQ